MTYLHALLAGGASAAKRTTCDWRREALSDPTEMENLPSDFEAFLALLCHRHALVMRARPDKNPGAFKDKTNRAGGTIFVEPELVNGTLQQGFAFLQGLGQPFQRAVLTMFMVNEVHPFSDGNGRTARIMMNAELIVRGQERIIIPTAYRTDYLGALRAISRNGFTTPLIRMLDHAQRYTHAIDWRDLKDARSALERTGAFVEGDDAKLRIP